MGVRHTAPAPLRRFAARLRELHGDCGSPSLRELAASLGRAGTPFSRSTINDKLGSVSKPSWEFVEAFVRACARHRGVPESRVDLDGWHRWYRQLLLELAALRTGQRRAAAAGTEIAQLDPTAVAHPAPVPIPRELPSDVPGFLGRTDELAALDRMLATAGRRSSAVPIAVLSGAAEAGKSALSVHWAHRVSAQFPDGQLYLDLHGYDGRQPVPPVRALSALLRSLGVPGPDVPDDAEECAARFRTLVADRRMLVVLDNASSVDQVRLLVPGTARCFVLVTSRRSLAELVLRHGAEHITLTPSAQAEPVQVGTRAAMKS